ncbi:MAG: IS630 family transposase [Promethearchaeota archaeon]
MVLFWNEVSVQFSPSITRMWSLKGQQPKDSTYGSCKRQHLVGAVEPLEGNLHMAFSNTLKAPQFQLYLEGPLAMYPVHKKLIIVLDNAQVHHSKVLELFLEANKDRLELIFLSPHSPDLNPMEWLWKFLRKMVTHNTFFGTFKEFQCALIKFIIKHNIFPRN